MLQNIFTEESPGFACKNPHWLEIIHVQFVSQNICKDESAGFPHKNPNWENYTCRVYVKKRLHQRFVCVTELFIHFRKAVQT